MTDDIVTRLRAIVTDPKPIFTAQLLDDAADEIERLREELRNTHTVIYRFVDQQINFRDLIDYFQQTQLALQDELSQKPAT
jgi:hypothetical protein